MRPQGRLVYHTPILQFQYTFYDVSQIPLICRIFKTEEKGLKEKRKKENNIKKEREEKITPKRR